jgi:4-aminobutyrate aminotransferase
MWDAFRGATLDAIWVDGEALFRRDIGPLLPGAEHVPPLDFASKDSASSSAGVTSSPYARP